MLLHTSQALIITLLAIIFVIYQQFFYAIANSMSLTNLGDALLMSASFLAVGGLSWSISQRLVLLEKIAERHVKEVERLNTINQEVVTQMINGVIVIDNQHIVLANTAAYQLLDIPSNSLVSLRDNSAENDHRRAHSKGAQYNAHSAQLTEFQEQLNEQHSQLLEACLTVATGQSRTFTYDLQIAASVFKKLRVQIIPLKDGSKLVILEDLRREQASAQQLKLASLGQLTASIAHEIRNPLATISQASQLLMEDITEPPHQETNQIENKHSTTNTSHSEIAANHELYNMIFSQTKRVNRIIEDILKLSRQHQANQKEIMLAEWLPTFLENYYQDHDVFLNITAQPTVSFDTHQLEQVLINLINNGLRYSSYSLSSCLRRN